MGGRYVETFKILGIPTSVSFVSLTTDGTSSSQSNYLEVTLSQAVPGISFTLSPSPTFTVSDMSNGVYRLMLGTDLEEDTTITVTPFSTGNYAFTPSSLSVMAYAPEPSEGLAPMTYDVVAPQVVAVNNKLYVYGGAVPSGNATNDFATLTSPSYVSTFSCYDPSSDSWSTLAMPTTLPTRRNAVFINGGNNKLYLYGGCVGSTVWSASDGASVTDSLQIYDIATNTWSAGTSSASGNYGQSYQVGSANSTTGFTVWGGISGWDTAFEDGRGYTFSSGAWAWNDGAYNGNFNASSIGINGTTVAVIVGGFTRTVADTTMTVRSEAYRVNISTANPSLTKLTNDPPYPTANAISCIYDGTLYVVGGAQLSGTNWVANTNPIMSYPTANATAAWNNNAGPNWSGDDVHFMGGGGLIGDKLYIVGGVLADGITPNRKVSVWDVATKVWL
jgi:hypothetical protein